MGSSINMRHMRAFVALAEHQHFTKAAEAIHLSQPALTALIKQLEADLGVQLIRRSTRAMALTEGGREFLVSARRLLLDFDDAMKSVSEYRAAKRGSVRIAALPSLCTSAIPSAIKTFNEAHPGVKVSVLEFFGERIVETVRERTVDFGLSYWHGEEDIAAEPVLADHLIAVGASKFLHGRQPLRWKDLEGKPIIAMAKGTTIRMLTESAATQAGIHLNIVLEPYLLPSAIAYAEAGLGVAIVSSALAPYKAAPGLRTVRLVAPAIKRTISLIHLHKNALSPVAVAFRNHILKATLSNPAAVAAR